MVSTGNQRGRRKHSMPFCLVLSSMRLHASVSKQAHSTRAFKYKWRFLTSLREISRLWFSPLATLMKPRSKWLLERRGERTQGRLEWMENSLLKRVRRRAASSDEQHVMTWAACAAIPAWTKKANNSSHTINVNRMKTVRVAHSEHQRLSRLQTVTADVRTFICINHFEASIHTLHPSRLLYKTDKLTNRTEGCDFIT